MCYKRVKRKELRILNDDMKFEEYRQWKQYICSKYQSCSKEKLIEFSRYLNLKIRDIKPSHVYWSIMAAAFVSVLFTMVMNFVMGMQLDISSNTFWSMLLITILLEFSFIAVLIYLIMKIVMPIYDNYFDENF